MKTITERLTEAATQATMEAVELAKGTSFVGPDGALVPPPTAAQALMAFQVYRVDAEATQQRLTEQLAEQTAMLQQQAGIINQQSGVIQQQQAILAALPDTLSAAIAGNNQQYVTPAVQATFQAIVGGTSPQAFATLTELMNHIGSLDTAEGSLLTQQSADRDRIATAETTLGSHATTLTSLGATVATKAAATDLAALTTTVAGKALASDVVALTSTVATKAAAADLTTLATTVNGKALATDLTALAATVSAKAAASDLSALQTTVNTKASTASVQAIATTAAQGVSDAAAQKNRVDSLLATTVPALQTDISARLLRTGDVASGSIMVPTATTAAAAPRLDQTYGGLNAPIRFATSVGTTAVAMSPGPLTDPTPQGRKAKPYLVVLTMRTAPTIGATITVGTTAGGAEVFTKTYTLALLPGLNAVLAPMQPIFIELPAGTMLYAKATAGTWDVEVLSYYKS